MREYQLIEVCSIEQASKVASMDAPAQSSDVKRYVKNNTLTYYILINTWVLLWKNFAPHAWLRLLESILNKGLIPAIAEMQDEAMRLIKEESLGPWARILDTELRFGSPILADNLIESAIGHEVLATSLFLLRYPKRFSPSDNDRIKEATLEDFLQYENRTKQLQRRTTFGYSRVVQRMRDIIRRMYPWDDICDRIEGLTASDILFSSGASRDAKSSALGLKVAAVAMDGNVLGFVRPIMGVLTLPILPAHEPSPRIARVVAVPKSYKSSRIIAMEDTYPIAMGKAIEMIFREYDKRGTSGINLESQEANQEYARKGSLDGTVSTNDASHASDLISKSLFTDVFPIRYVRLVRRLLPEYIEVTLQGNEQTRLLQMSSTSGHTLTFRHETIVYLSICKAAVEVGKDLGIPMSTEACVAYGDDTGVPVEVLDIAKYMFQRVGLVINDDKTFGTGHFRESCGKDYFGGVDVTSIYYPRFPVIGTFSGKKGEEKISFSSRTFNDDFRGKLDNSLSMLIDLQKKLYPYSYECARFLASIVQTAYPDVTTSTPGTVCNDLWDSVDSGSVYIPKTWALKEEGKYLPHRKKWVQLGLASDGLHGENAKVFDRLCSLDTFHTYPSIRWEKEQKEQTGLGVAYYEYWKYTNFLRYGPRYADALSELLGISEEPMSYDEFYGHRTLALTRKR